MLLTGFSFVIIISLLVISVSGIHLSSIEVNTEFKCLNALPDFLISSSDLSDLYEINFPPGFKKGIQYSLNVLRFATALETARSNLPL